jgi:hypothetical protein
VISPLTDSVIRARFEDRMSRPNGPSNPLVIVLTGAFERPADAYAGALAATINALVPTATNAFKAC